MRFYFNLGSVKGLFCHFVLNPVICFMAVINNELGLNVKVNLLRPFLD